MAKQKLANPPPETKVVASGDLSPEETKELAAKAKKDSPVEKTPVEDTGIKLKPISEQITVGTPSKEVSPSPDETEKVTTEDVTHDPLKDTQRRMHEEIEKRQALEGKLEKIEGDMKALISGVVSERQLHNTTEPSRESEPPTEFFDPNPTEDEKIDPILYNQRMRRVDAYNKAKEEKARAIMGFVKENPDWKQWQPKMNEISEKMPSLKYGPDSLSNLLELAKKDKQIEDMKETLKEAEEAGLTAGAQIEKNKTEVFVKPGAASPRASVTVPNWDGLNPATGRVWTSDEMAQWAKENGLYRES